MRAPGGASFAARPGSQQVHAVLQQLLPGFAREAEGAVLRAGEAGAPRRRCQLLEVGLLGGAATGIHGRRGIPGGGERDDRPCAARAHLRPQAPREVRLSGPVTLTAAECGCRGSEFEVQASAPVTVSLSFPPAGRWDRARGGNRRMAAPLGHQLWQTLSCGQDHSTHSRGVTPCDRQGPSGVWLGKAARLTSVDCPWRATGQVKGGRAGEQAVT